MSAGIYRITNNITGAIYIGYTVNLNNRQQDYRSLNVKSQPLIFNSLKEYGYENHSFDVLKEWKNSIPKTRHLKSLENEYIKHYRYVIKATMLNVNDGGGGSGSWSEEKKKQKSIDHTGKSKLPILQYDLEGRFIKRWVSISLVSKELGINYTQLVRCLKGKPQAKTAGGFQWKYDKKSSTSKLGQYDLNGNLLKIWNNRAEFMHSIGKKKDMNNSINHVCRGYDYKGRRLTAYGYVWKKIEDNLDGMIYDDIPSVSSIMGKPILQYDLDGNFIREWQSVLEASNILNVSKQTIYDGITGKTNKLFSRKNYNYQWRYKDGESFSLKINKLTIPVIVQYTLSGELVKVWQNCTDAAKALGCSRNSITDCVRGNTKKANGFIWTRNYNDNIPESTTPFKKVMRNRFLNIDESILQYDLNGNFIKAWNYPAEVTHVLGIDQGSIVRCIKGMLKTCGGFQWKIGNPNNPNIVNAITKHKPPKDYIYDENKSYLQYHLNGDFIRAWNYPSEITHELGINPSSIVKCTQGILKSVGKYQWRIGNKNNAGKIPPVRIICQYDLQGNLINEWESIVDINKKTGFGMASISACISGRTTKSRGFVWKYK